VDEFTISIPRERPFGAVAGLVVGGIAARHEVTLDVLDDLQLALDALLDAVGSDPGHVTIVLRVVSGAIGLSVGPLPTDTAGTLEQDAGAGIDLKRLLETVVDDVVVASRDGGSWVELQKAYVQAESAS
jgi:hypothetical protein